MRFAYAIRRGADSALQPFSAEVLTDALAGPGRAGPGRCRAGQNSGGPRKQTVHLMPSAKAALAPNPYAFQNEACIMI